MARTIRELLLKFLYKPTIQATYELLELINNSNEEYFIEKINISDYTNLISRKIERGEFSKIAKIFEELAKKVKFYDINAELGKTLKKGFAIDVFDKEYDYFSYKQKERYYLYILLFKIRSYFASKQDLNLKIVEKK